MKLGTTQQATKSNPTRVYNVIRVKNDVLPTWCAKLEKPRSISIDGTTTQVYEKSTSDYIYFELPGQDGMRYRCLWVKDEALRTQFLKEKSLKVVGEGRAFKPRLKSEDTTAPAPTKPGKKVKATTEAPATPATPKRKLKIIKKDTGVVIPVEQPATQPQLQA